MNLKRLQKVIESIGEELPPKDDWMPALIMEGDKEVTVYGFVGRSLENDRAKNLVAEKIIECISQFKPNVACFITTAWSIDMEKGGISEIDLELWRSGLMKISEHPDRIEIVSAYVYGVKEPHKGEAFMIGYIQRYPDKGPSIKKWKMVEDGASAEGRFPDAIKQGFQLAGLIKGG